MTLHSASLADLLALYDYDERFAATYPYLLREEVASVVRHVDLLSKTGTVIYSQLDEASVEAAIDEELAYFQARGLEFEWKAYAHDQPADLIHRLAQHGFQVDEPEAILVLDLDDPFAPPPGNQTVRVKRLEHPDELATVASIRQNVYGSDVSDSIRRLRLEMELEQDRAYLSVYVAFVDDTPAACGWIRFPKGSAFASMWGGSTIPGLRGQGMYTALVATRVHEARGRGARYVSVDARNTSRPILEKHGFVRLTTATACNWSPAAHQPS
jgi:GNAT superfamily N-acetyltransferase